MAILILFDHGTPRGIARALSGHEVITVYDRGWDRMNNGDLLKAAQDEAVEVLLNTDQNIRHQQNLTGRKIALVVITGTTKWSRIRLYLERITVAVNAATPGSYIEVEIPFEDDGP